MSYTEEFNSIISGEVQEEFTVDGRKIVGDYDNIAVTTDDNANKIWFSMPDKFDGVDLYDKTIRIGFVTPDNCLGYSDPSDLVHSTGVIKFSWLIDRRITRIAGKVSFAIRVTDGDNYVWNTLPAYFEVKQGIVETGDIAPDDRHWYDELKGIVDNLDAQQISQNATITGIAADTVEDALKQLNKGMTYYASRLMGFWSAIPIMKGTTAKISISLIYPISYSTWKVGVYNEDHTTVKILSPDISCGESFVTAALMFTDSGIDKLNIIIDGDFDITLNAQISVSNKDFVCGTLYMN